jgi:hypothetical protein
MGENEKQFCEQHHLVLEHHQQVGRLLEKATILFDKQEIVFGDIADIKLSAAANASNIATLLKITGQSNGNSKQQLPGAAGWLNRSWDGFCDKIGPWIIGMFFILLFWALAKTYIFKELPFGLINK